MLDRRYYESWNKNDNYELKKEVIVLLEELDYFDSRLRKFLGPKKVKKAGVDARRSCRSIEKTLFNIKKKIQMIRQDYDSDYEDL